MTANVLDFAPLQQRLGYRAGVDVLELAAEGHAAGDPAHPQLPRPQHFRHVVGGGLAFIGEIRRQDDFLHLAAAGALEQLVETDVARADPVEGRETPHEHEIHARIAQGLLDHRQIGRGLHDAKQRSVATRRAAQRADLLFAEVVAARATAHGIEGVFERFRQLVRAFAIVLQQVVGHALRRARPDAGQHAQRLQQALQTLRRRNGVLAQNGSLKPAGRPRPAVMPAIFSLIAASTLRAASLNAAVTRSSSISRSSLTSDGSMLTRFTSCLPVISTFTMPAPDCPSTSMVVRLSCMRRMFSCIICACFISCPMLPFMASYFPSCRMLESTTLPSSMLTRSFTKPSFCTDCAAAARAASRSPASTAAAVAPETSPTVSLIVTGEPRCCSSAAFSLSW